MSSSSSQLCPSLVPSFRRLSPDLNINKYINQRTDIQTDSEQAVALAAKYILKGKHMPQVTSPIGMGTRYLECVTWFLRVELVQKI